MLLPNDVVDVFAASDGRGARRLGVGAVRLRLVLRLLMPESSKFEGC